MAQQLQQQQNGHIQECQDVIVNFRHLTPFTFMLKSVGFEQEGHQVLAVALVVNLAIGNNILRKRSDGVGYGNLGLKGGKRKRGDGGEQPQNEHGNEGRVFTTHLILSRPEFGDLHGIRSITNGIEVVTKSDATDNVHGDTGGIVKYVDLDGRLAGSMNLVSNAGLEGGSDVVDVGVHFADVIRREGGSDESTHALVVLLTLDPGERAASEA